MASLALGGCLLDRSGAPLLDSGVAPDTGPARCANDRACDDGLFCNGFEICADGVCSAGPPPGCADTQACTIDVCDEADDSCLRLPDHASCAADELCSPSMGCLPVDPCATSAECDDGFVCNGAERCEDDRCVPGAPPSCADGVECTVDACSEARGGCVAIADDSACEGELVCDGAACVPPTLCTDDAECDDGNFCDGAERCVAGRCAAGTAPDCSDAVSCTVDACDEPTDACVHVADDGLCPFDQECLAASGCTFVGDCASPADCDDGFFCNGVELCTGGRCAAGTAPTCGDTVSCTVDLCDEVAEGCARFADDSLCAANETCDAAVGCTPECASASDCDDGLFCNGAELCVSGGCAPGAAPDCADAVSCTVDGCDETADTCRNLPDDGLCGGNETCVLLAGCTPECDGASDCDDGFFCNGAELCVGGGCAPGAAPDCDDMVACTVDGCDETANTCRSAPDSALCGANETCDVSTGCTPECTAAAECDDGLFCNGAELCVSGGCAPGAAPDCADAVSCTVDGCDETADTCRNFPNDGLCGVNETCDAASGCTPECESASDCDDGFFCNGAELCVSGGCVPGTAPDCDDLVSCTLDGCDETANLCRNLPDDSACGANEACDAALGCTPECESAADCDDGLFCNGAELCVSGGCAPGAAPDCDDTISCTVDLCDEAGNRCLWVPDDAMCGGPTEVCASTGCAELGAAENPGTSCAAILLARPAAPDGAYWVDPDGAPGQAVREVYCDMSTDGGGWMLALETDQSSYAHATAAAVNPALLTTPAIDGVAKHADDFLAAVQAVGTGELRIEALSVTPLLYVKDQLFSVPDPGSYSTAIFATTDLGAGYSAGEQCYDGDGVCEADAWCFGLDPLGAAEHACLRRSATPGLWLDGGSYTPGYYDGRVWIR